MSTTDDQLSAPAPRFMEDWSSRQSGRAGGSSVAVAAGFPRELSGSDRERSWAAAALAGRVEEVASTPEGQRNGVLNDAGMRLYRLALAGLLDAEHVTEQLVTAGHRAGLPERECRRTLQSASEGARRAGAAIDVPHDPPSPRELHYLPTLPAVGAVELAGHDVTAPDDLWSARPVLTYLHQFARARCVSPWALLGVVLARVVAVVPPWVVLPPLTGGVASLNLFVALVGPSGSGKGAAEAAAREALRLGEVTEAAPGSGEGITHAFVAREKGELRQHTTNVLFTLPEVDTLSGLAARQGSTISSQLRSLWSGERLGFTTADPTRRVSVGHHEYRAALLLGVQPDRAGELLRSADGGLPQRFLWMPATDPAAPDVPPVQPEPYVLTPQPWMRPPHLGQRVLPIPEEVRAAVHRARLAGLRGEAEALDGHAVLARLKVATALALLERRDNVDPEDWRLAGLVQEVSDRTRAGVLARLVEVSQQANQQQGRSEGIRAAVADDARAEAAEQRVVRWLVRKLEGGPLTEGEMRKAAASRDRGHLPAALELATTAGMVTRDGAVVTLVGRS